MEIIYVRPGRCNTCKHHIIGDYSREEDYCEHSCEVEENETPGWFPGMHLDYCVFPASSTDEACPAYEMMSLEQAMQQALRPWEGGEL